MNIAGPRAEHIANLLGFFTGVTAVVYVAVTAALVWALLRKRRQAQGASSSNLAAADRSSRVVIGAATALTVLVLIALGAADFFVQRYLFKPPDNPLRVIVTGHQYWWEVEYDDPDPSQHVRTANEIHIPVGRPVQLDLTSRDVIHSFWVPAITGKKDLIPGYRNTEVLLADKPGLYTGQCAEFCGLQHAKMSLQLYAEMPDQFEQWRQSQLQSAKAPATDTERRGLAVFTQASCILCHSVQGTDAGATVGPDLTHIASRQTIAAGSLPNTPGNLASWITAPHVIKPGVQMPATALPPEDLAALTQYLVSLR